jgi:hypothetical protein
VPLFSVQSYVQGLLNGLPVPGVPTQTLTAQIRPPVLQNLDQPMCFVWGGAMEASREAGPRGPSGAAGFKHLGWQISTWVVYLTNPTAATADTAFPQLLDAVMAKMWSTPSTVLIDASGNVTMQTPSPSGVTQLLSIGERFRLDYSPVHTPASDRMLYYSARFDWEIYEAVQA